MLQAYTRSYQKYELQVMCEIFLNETIIDCSAVVATAVVQKIERQLPLK